GEVGSHRLQAGVHEIPRRPGCRLGQGALRQGAGVEVARSCMSTPPGGEAGAEHVLGADGRFHAVDEEVRLSIYGWEDWIVLAVFWILAFVVFYQVSTRYVLNDAAGWTEEIARYLLIAVTFLGGAMAVRRNTHIQVDFVYRFLPRAAGRVLSLLVDAVRAAFFGYAVWLTWLLMDRIGSQRIAVGVLA